MRLFVKRLIMTIALFECHLDQRAITNGLISHFLFRHQNNWLFKANLSERQRLWSGAANGTNRLFHQGHGKPLMRDTMASCALVLGLVAGQVKMNSKQYVFLDFCYKLFLFSMRINLCFKYKGRWCEKLTKHSAASSMKPSWKRCWFKNVSANARRSASGGKADSWLYCNCANNSYK